MEQVNVRELVVLKGLPNSGINEYADEWVRKAPLKRVRVSRQRIFASLGTPHCQETEAMVNLTEAILVIEALRKGFSVIMDSPNLKRTKKNTEQWLDQQMYAFYGTDIFAEIYGDDFSDVVNVVIEDRFLEMPLEEVLQRNEETEDNKELGIKKHTENYIKYLHRKYIEPEEVLQTTMFD